MFSWSLSFAKWGDADERRGNFLGGSLSCVGYGVRTFAEGSLLWVHVRTGWPLNPCTNTTLQIVSSCSSPEPRWPNSKAGPFGSTRIERPRELGSWRVFGDKKFDCSITLSYHYASPSSGIDGDAFVDGKRDVVIISSCGVLGPTGRLGGSLELVGVCTSATRRIAGKCWINKPSAKPWRIYVAFSCRIVFFFLHTHTHLTSIWNHQTCTSDSNRKVARLALVLCLGNMFFRRTFSPLECRQLQASMSVWRTFDSVLLC